MLRNKRTTTTTTAPRLTDLSCIFYLVTPDVGPAAPRKVRSTTCLLVALANGDVRLYDDEKNLLHTLKTMEPIAALRFGPYAREDGALAVVSTAGGWVGGC